jgi:signal transduction histidine kinase
LTGNDRRARPTLRAKLISWSFIPTAIVLVAVAGVILYAFQRATEDLVVERDRELTRLMARQVSTEIEPYERTLIEVAELLAAEADPGVRCALLQHQASRLRLYDGGVALLDADGVVRTTVPMDARQLRRNWSERDGVERALTAGLVAYTSVGRHGPDDAESVEVVAPLLSEHGGVLGALVGVFALRDGTLSSVYRQAEQQVARRLAQDPLHWQGSAAGGEGAPAGLTVLLQRAGLTRFGVSSTASAHLVDRYGVVIHGTSVELVGQRLPMAEAQGLISAGQVGAVRTRSLAGRPVVACYAPIGSSGWGLVTQEDWNTLYAPARRLGYYLMALVALGVLVPGLVVTAAVRRITRPVDTLVAATRRVGAGDFGRVELDTRDELAELADGFNQMSARLEALYADLERRVADRTRELRTLLGVSQEVSSTLSPQQVLTAGLQALLTLVGADEGAACALSAGAHESQEIVVSLGPLRCEPDELRETIVRADAAGAADGKPTVVGLGARDVRALVVPLHSPEAPLGHLVALLPPADTLLEPRQALVASIGQQVSVALGNALLFERASAVATEAERQRLARDLHDSVAQAVYGVSLYARATERLLDAGQVDAARGHLTELQDSARQALAEMRLLIYQARPAALEQGHLAEALRARLDHVESRAGMTAELEVALSAPLGPDVEEALYHVATEALNNVLRHANANRVHTRLETCDGLARLVVADDGQGFDTSSVGAGGIGLGSMRSRIREIGGRLTIESAPGKGTVVRVEVPM